MREYGQIQSAFWHSKDCEAFSDRAKLLACYLMTSPHTNGIGCFRIGPGTMSDDLKWSAEQLHEGFQELANQGFAFYHELVVLMPNFLRWNRIANGNVAKARFQEWEQVPKGKAKAFAACAMIEFSDHWTADHRAVLVTVGETVSDTPITVLKNQNPTQPNPTQPYPDPTQSLLSDSTKLNEKSAKVSKPKIKPVPDRFDEFWQLYPRKESKATALKSFAKLATADAAAAIAALPLFARSWKWRFEPQFIPHASTWLNQRRWEEIPPPEHEPGRRPDPVKPSRGAAITQALLDHRYAQTAARQSGLALGHDHAGPVDAHTAAAPVSAGPRHDRSDLDGLDERDEPPRFRDRRP